MVLLGHSMGGLLSHAMAVDSGDRFWRINSDQPFDTILGPAGRPLAKLKQYLFFDAQPFVEPRGLPGDPAPRLGQRRGAWSAGSGRT